MKQPLTLGPCQAEYTHKREQNTTLNRKVLEIVFNIFKIPVKPENFLQQKTWYKKMYPELGSHPIYTDFRLSHFTFESV